MDAKQASNIRKRKEPFSELDEDQKNVVRRVSPLPKVRISRKLLKKQTRKPLTRPGRRLRVKEFLFIPAEMKSKRKAKKPKFPTCDIPVPIEKVSAEVVDPVIRKRAKVPMRFKAAIRDEMNSKRTKFIDDDKEVICNIRPACNSNANSFSYEETYTVFEIKIEDLTGQKAIAIITDEDVESILGSVPCETYPTTPMCLTGFDQINGISMMNTYPATPMCLTQNTQGFIANQFNSKSFENTYPATPMCSTDNTQSIISSQFKSTSNESTYPATPMCLVQNTQGFIANQFNSKSFENTYPATPMCSTDNSSNNSALTEFSHVPTTTISESLVESVEQNVIEIGRDQELVTSPKPNPEGQITDIKVGVSDECFEQIISSIVNESIQEVQIPKKMPVIENRWPQRSNEEITVQAKRDENKKTRKTRGFKKTKNESKIKVVIPKTSRKIKAEPEIDSEYLNSIEINLEEDVIKILKYLEDTVKTSRSRMGKQMKRFRWSVAEKRIQNLKKKLGIDELDDAEKAAVEKLVSFLERRQ